MLTSEHESDTEKHVLDWKRETINECHPYRNSD